MAKSVSADAQTRCHSVPSKRCAIEELVQFESIRSTITCPPWVFILPIPATYSTLQRTLLVGRYMRGRPSSYLLLAAVMALNCLPACLCDSAALSSSFLAMTAKSCEEMPIWGQDRLAAQSCLRLSLE